MITSAWGDTLITRGSDWSVSRRILDLRVLGYPNPGQSLGRGMCGPEVRLPLVQVKDSTKEKISNALKVAKIL